MKKILAGILFLFLVVATCFAEFSLKPYTGYFIFWESQTIEKTTLYTGLNNCCMFKYITANNTVYDVDTNPHSWPKDKITEKSVTLWAEWDCEEKSMKESLTSYIKEAEDKYGMDFSELLKKIENMEFEDKQ